MYRIVKPNQETVIIQSFEDKETVVVVSRYYRRGYTVYWENPYRKDFFVKGLSVSGNNFVYCKFISKDFYHKLKKYVQQTT